MTNSYFLSFEDVSIEFLYIQVSCEIPIQVRKLVKCHGKRRFSRDRRQNKMIEGGGGIEGRGRNSRRDN